MKLFQLTKKMFLGAFLLVNVNGVFAQQQLNNVIIKATNETTTESDGEGMGMMGGPRETKIEIVIKDTMTKVVVNSSFFNSTTIKNTSSNVITSLTEMQGEKTGYTTNDADRKDQKRRMDSLQKENANNPAPGGAMVVRMGQTSNVKEINYTADTKTINGIDCKKAIVSMVNNEGVETKIDVWYTDAYTFPEGTLTGVRGIMNFGTLNGIPVQYATVNKMKMMNNEMTMTNTFTVTELKQNATIEAKQFEIPKGYKVKSYAEYVKDNPTGAPQIMRSIRIGG